MHRRTFLSALGPLALAPVAFPSLLAAQERACAYH